METIFDKTIETIQEARRLNDNQETEVILKGMLDTLKIEESSIWVHENYSEVFKKLAEN